VREASRGREGGPTNKVQTLVPIFGPQVSDVDPLDVIGVHPDHPQRLLRPHTASCQEKRGGWKGESYRVAMVFGNPSSTMAWNEVYKSSESTTCQTIGEEKPGECSAGRGSSSSSSIPDFSPSDLPPTASPSPPAPSAHKNQRVGQGEVHLVLRVHANRLIPLLDIFLCSFIAANQSLHCLLHALPSHRKFHKFHRLLTRILELLLQESHLLLQSNLLALLVVISTFPKTTFETGAEFFVVLLTESDRDPHAGLFLAALWTGK
jgi:hypothetical protein